MLQKNPAKKRLEVFMMRAIKPVLLALVFTQAATTSNALMTCRPIQNRPFAAVKGFPSLAAASTSSNAAEASAVPSSSSTKYPQGAVSTAVRLNHNETPHYLLIQRGKAPNAGKWSFPGGRLEWGESALEGAQRELAEETKFECLDSNRGDNGSHLRWHPEPYGTADSIIHGDDDDDDSSDDDARVPKFHYLIAISFAELVLDEGSFGCSLPKVTSQDDAKNAQWWSLKDIQHMDVEATTPGLIQRVERAEFLYQQGALL
jgi:ADP-ribose pyrophosphatase YjhB (NUDIX family)